MTSIDTREVTRKARAGLLALIRAEPTERAAIAELLDGLTDRERVAVLKALAGPGPQRRLYMAVRDLPPVRLEDLVPASTPPLQEVIFEGKNSLPAFTRFQKRFCRAPGSGRDARLWGYNHQALEWLTGPGYFVAREDPSRGTALDYGEIPEQAVDGWPVPRPNDRGLSTFVFKDLVDYIRRVSRDVFIGSAHRRGRELGNFFVLCRLTAHG